MIRNPKSRRALLNEAIAAAMKTFQNNMTTHVELVDVEFMDTTKGIKDSTGKKQLERALALTEQNRFNDACDIFKQGANKYPKSNAYIYNAGICYEADGNYEKALDFYTKVDNRLNKPIDYLSDAIVRVRKRIADVAKYKRRAEQKPTVENGIANPSFYGITTMELKAATEPEKIKQQKKQQNRQQRIREINNGRKFDLSENWDIYLDENSIW